MTDFAQLLSRSLPGVYRLRDDSGDLARFLGIIASPLAETEASIGQLYEDLFGASARGELLPFIGDLIGASIDPTLPASLQRAALEDTLAFYRDKGLAEPLERTVEAFTGWPTVTVDYSQVVARLPYIQTLSPLQRRRGRPVGVASGGTNRFTFDATGRATPLFDDLRGRPIARDEIASLAADLVGTDRGFAIRESGVDLVGPRAAAPRATVGANLTDFADPRAVNGTPLVLASGQIAVDPELGRLLFAAPVPLAGNLSVDFHQLDPASIAPQTFDLRDPDRMARLGRSDDPAPYTLDVRSPSRPGDRIGRAHFDNHGLFLTVGQSVDNRRPSQLRVGPPSGFSFDDRPLAAGDTVGNPLQLLDGIDGSLLTIAKLAARASDFADSARGFTIRVRGVSLLDPSFGGGARVVAAQLADLANPRDAGGAALTLQPRDIAVDPQLGRFLMSLAGFGVNAGDLRVGYLLARGVRSSGTSPAPVGSAGSNTFSFSADGSMAALRDAFDGTPLSTKIRFGATIADVHGKARGYRIFVGSTDITNAGTLTPQVADIDGPKTVAAGQMLVDLDRGRFAVPAGTIPTGTPVTVEYSAADTSADARVFDSLAQRLPHLVPAGIVPVVIDTRKSTVDPVNFELTARATQL
ncbi:MAG TPA: hypothetical protein VFD36_15480 [Kofleriaceae bacterium]|nr:hypothetical protein [Kofleriaceae bacterium]